MIDSKKLARIRNRVVGGYLSKLGYAASGKEYLAKVGPQLRYVSFSAAKYGKAFDVSIALHFDFLPPFKFAVWPGARIPGEMCSELCAFQRLVRSHDGRQYYEYGETEAAASEMLRDIAVRAATGLDEIGAVCGDGRRLLELISPQVLAVDLTVFKRLLEAPTIEEQTRLSARMRIRQLLPEWYPHITPTAILLCYLAHHHARSDLIPGYLAVAPEDSIKADEAPYFEDLRRRVT